MEEIRRVKEQKEAEWLEQERSRSRSKTRSASKQRAATLLPIDQTIQHSYKSRDQQHNDDVQCVIDQNTDQSQSSIFDLKSKRAFPGARKNMLATKPSISKPILKQKYSSREKLLINQSSEEELIHSSKEFKARDGAFDAKKKQYAA